MSTNTHPTPRVPPELVDHIIGFLHEDKATLSTLTTVCRTFYPAAALHLFYSVSIDIGSQSLKDFEEFLQHVPPFICKGVKKLDIRGTPEIVSLFGRTSEKKLSISALASLLPHIPNLSELCLRSVSLTSATGGTFPVDVITPHPLDRLSISRVRASAGPVDVCILLSLFSDIRTLRIEDSTWSQIRPDPEGAVRQIDSIQNIYPSLFVETKVTNLEMDASLYTRSFLEILRRTKTAECLRHVAVICSNMLELWSLGNFLEHVGHSVDHVAFNITRLYEGETPEIADHVRTCLSLKPSCPSMKSLGLRLNLDAINPWATTAMFAIVPCLIQNAPASLRELAVEIDLPFSTLGPRRIMDEREIVHLVDKTMVYEWNWLAAVSEERPDIRHIRVVWRTGPVHYPILAQQLSSIVRKKVPNLVERSILDFASCTS